MAIKVSAGRQGQYTKYKNGNVYVKNKTRKLTRLMKLNPNNTQLALALKSISWRRKTPKTREWNKTSRRETELKKLFKVPSGYIAPVWTHKQGYDNMWLRANIIIANI